MVLLGIVRGMLQQCFFCCCSNQFFSAVDALHRGGPCSNPISSIFHLISGSFTCFRSEGAATCNTWLREQGWPEEDVEDVLLESRTQNHLVKAQVIRGKWALF